MFKFIFGLAWTVFVTPIFVACLFVPGEQRGGMDMNIFLFIFFIVFELIGLCLMISGLKKVIKDKKTKRFGLLCYGIIHDIQETGAYVNNNPEYKVIMNVVNPETRQLQILEEVIGFNYDKYPINSYILCKYWQGDINLEKIISENEVPGDIKINLVPTPQVPNYSNLEFSPDREYVTIDGIQYKKNQ